MSDKRNAAFCATVFIMLAEEPTEKNKQNALRIWNAIDGYEFSAYHMGCDDALAVLGLYRRAVDPKYPNEGEVDIYGPAPEGAPTTATDLASVLPRCTMCDRTATRVRVQPKTLELIWACADHAGSAARVMPWTDLVHAKE